MHIDVSLTEEAIDVGGVVAAAGDKAAGAVVSFIGTVRSSSSLDSASDRAVLALFYEAYVPLAERRLNEIASQAAERWELVSAVIAHRVGRCELGEATVAIACSSAHRAEAFAATRWIIEALKASVPIWKSEVYEDGEHWVGMGS